MDNSQGLSHRESVFAVLFFLKKVFRQNWIFPTTHTPGCDIVNLSVIG